MYRNLLCLFAILFFCSSENIAQTKQFHFKNYSTKNGISKANIQHTLQDQQGFLWISTNGGGINKFDGYEFTNYFASRTDTAHSLPSNTINLCVQDHNGTIWAATNNGIALYNAALDIFEPFTEFNSLINLQTSITQILVLDNEQMLIGTGGLGLVWLDRKNKEFRQYTDVSNIFPSPYVKDIIRDYDGNIWVAHDEGISKVTGEGNALRFENFTADATKENWLRNPYIKDIESDKEGNIWFACDNGIGYYNPTENTFKQYEIALNSNTAIPYKYCKNVCIDDNGFVWIAHDLGISVLNPSTNIFRHIQPRQGEATSLASNYTKHISQDAAGNMWISTDEGLSMFDPIGQAFINLQNNPSNPKSINSSLVYSVFKDQKGNLLVGTNEGLNILNEELDVIQKFHVGSPNSFLTNAYVKSIYQSKNGTYWIGTDDGLFQLHKTARGHWKTIHVYRKPSLLSDAILGIHEDKLGYIWINTWNGTARINPSTKHIFFPHKQGHYEAEKANRGSLINTLMISQYDGHIYMSSKDIFNPKTLEFIPSEITKVESEVMCFFEDENNIIWIGTLDNGIYKFDQKKKTILEHYRAGYELPNYVIASIISDEEQNLWMGTNNGILKFNPTNKEYVRYTSSEGVQEGEFCTAAVHKDKDGVLYFAGKKGLNIYKDNVQQENEYKIPIIFTELMLANKTVDINDETQILSSHINLSDTIDLSHDQNFITIKFAGLGFRNPKYNKYAYRMIGLQDEWFYTDATNRRAVFANLPFGEFTFEVKAANDKGVWNDQTKKLTVIIHAPWWQEQWFKAFCIVLMILITTAAVRWRLYRLEKQKILLEHEVDLRTQELVATNEELHQQTEEVLSQRDQIENQMHKIKKQHNELASSFNELEELSIVGKRVTEGLSVDSILETLYKNLKNLMELDTFVLGLFNKNSQCLELSWIDNQSGQTLSSIDLLNEKGKLTVWSFCNEKSVVINNFNQDVRSYIKQPFQDSEYQSHIYVPLTINGETIGVLAVQCLKENIYQRRQVSLFESLASYVSTALANAQSFEVIRTKNTLITNSIRYAKSIQDSILPLQHNLEALFSKHFIIYRPKDIVSGDFYWHLKYQNELNETIHFIAIIDCTGHGVPGALMSMVGARLLDEIITINKIESPAEVLEALNTSVKKVFRQDEEGSTNTDGMDMALCAIKAKENNSYNVIYSGAKIPFYYKTDENSPIQYLSSCNKAIGGIQRKTKYFTDQEITLEKGAQIYLSTDGYYDQNNAERKKLGRKKFEEILMKTPNELNAKATVLTQILDEFQQNEEQRDDITVLGFEL